MGEKQQEIHVISRKPGIFFCLHCGEMYEMNLPAPVDVFVGAMEAFNKTHQKCKLGSRGLACANCFRFGHEREKCERLNYNGDWRKWLEGPDTGASSRTLCRALAHGPDVVHQSIYFPLDDDDFGRCYRLLKAIPGWRARIGEVRNLKGWAPLVDAWDELERLYEEELRSRNFKRFRERLDAVNKQRKDDEARLR